MKILGNKLIRLSSGPPGTYQQLQFENQLQSVLTPAWQQLGFENQLQSLLTPAWQQLGFENQGTIT